MTARATFTSVAGLNKALRKLPKEASAELRAASLDISREIADKARVRALGVGGVMKLVAPTIKASYDRVPSVRMGSTAKLPDAGDGWTHDRSGERQTIGDVIWGGEFGGGARPTTTQFLPHLGTTGYALWPTVREESDDMTDRWLEGLDRALAGIEADMNADRILLLKLLGDTSSIDKSLKKSQGRLRSFAGSAGSWMKAAGIGLAIEGVGKLGEALGDAWTGFRDGEKAAGQLGTTWKNLHLDGSRLQGVIDDISASSLKLGTDDTEAIKAYNTALQNTGGKPAKAMDRLRIAQDLVANGSAPNLQSALKLIDRAASGSAATVRKFGLKSDTAAGRVKELGEKVKGAAKHARDLDPLGAASNAIGEGLETIVGALSKGDLDGAAEGLTAIATALGTFGTDIAPGVTTALDAITDGAWSEFSDWVGTTFTPVVDDLGEAIRAMGLIWDGLQPKLSAILTFIQPVIDLMSTSVAGGLGFILDSITGTLRTMADLINGDFTGALGTITSTLGTLGTDLDTFLFGIPGKLTSIAGDVLTEAQKVGDNIFDGISGAVADLARYIAQTWNGIGAFDAGGFTFAEAFDIEVMGQHVGWPKIAVEWGAGDLIPNIAVPELATGGIVKKRPGGILARIGEGRFDEAVVPLDGRGRGGNTYILNVHATPGTDRRALGLEILGLIRAAEGIDGRSWRTAPGR